MVGIQCGEDGRYSLWLSWIFGEKKFELPNFSLMIQFKCILNFDESYREALIYVGDESAGETLSWNLKITKIS